MLSQTPYPSRLQYGDGHFTTVKVTQGAAVNWAAHKARLDEACARLAMAPIDWQTLAPAVFAKAKALGEGGLKILVARAAGGRGYKPAAGANAVWLSDFQEPAHYPLWREQGIALSLLPVTLGSSPLLAGLKHCNRLEQVLAAQSLEALSADEGVLLDEQGQLVSAVSANIFWFEGDKLFTPRLERCGVAGTLRALVIDKAEVNKVTADFSRLLAADEIFITNALMGIVPVRQLEARTFSAFPRTRLTIGNLHL
ncbi:aminodeoxychorismate lyase [Gallaecimonas mangrovi]|uniref:aminodeoxychorismate lyase n=1 Tax=Gallaecimonas mangrovi TaxID=2291597 RepID=UPI000E1FCB73|nr:aminodeoxychorismate lyase [Gallaecimonas mangrovi]